MPPASELMDDPLGHLALASVRLQVSDGQTLRAGLIASCNTELSK